MTVKKHLTTFLLLFFISGHCIFAQSEIYHPNSVGEIKELQEGDLYLNLGNKHFFINNEYSKPLVKGYTLPGQTIEPILKYLTAGGHLQLEAGFQAKHFFGRHDPISLFPIFTAQLNITSSTQFILGTLRGGIEHQTSDILFQNEYHYSSKPEYGIQLRHSSKKLWMDLWVNWETFIEHGDTIHEQFTAGLNMRVPLLSTTSGWEITAPLQTVIVHVGGEISDFQENGRSDMNNLVGLEVAKTNSGFFDRWGVFGHYYNYKEMKSIKNNAFSKGEGIDAGAFIKKENHSLRASWWNGHKYQSLRGNHVYQSVSNYDENRTFRNRYMFTGKYAYKKEIANNLTFSFMFEGYYDLKQSYFDYSYGIQILFVPQFFLKNITPISQ